MPYAEYESRKARLSEQMRRARDVRIAKDTSNLFRERAGVPQERLSVRDFNHVLAVNREGRWADVEGMTTYENLVDGTLPHGFMPAVVPQLKTITVGGAVAGLGIESSSFRYGLVHETVIEMEILLANGDTVVCSKEENADLFYGFPNSYGALGYALRLRVMLIPVKPFVKIAHTRYGNAPDYFEALKKICATPAGAPGGVDFVDGTIFTPQEMYMTTGTFTDAAEKASDYTYENIYYKSIKTRSEDLLSVRDYIWRWDTDWFWCSMHFGAQNPLLRPLFGKKRLNSAGYWKIRAIAQRHPTLLALSRGFTRREQIIQDVDVPIAAVPDFFTFFFDAINIRPVWVCPFRAYDKTARFSLCPFDPETTYVNFGFWDSVPTKKENGHYNRLIEKKVSDLHGKKGLYSDSFYTPEEFWAIYDKDAYDMLKKKYDPQGKLKDLFQKAVKAQ
ncbi:MAG TPA: FAD-binding oxidoreductase [Candidatus Paceibacterota bacterium]|nr:FAD-binding oxidoreductase [Candidatus Paceibacterota bacterium]